MADTVAPWLQTMRALVGTQEFSGSPDNPAIMSWPDEIARRFPEMTAYCRLYTGDEIAWCGLTLAYVLAKNGIRPPFGNTDTRRFLWANSFASDWGQRLPEPVPGCIVVFKWAGGGGHVGIVEKDNGSTIDVIGGNQSDAINVTTFAKGSIVAYVWPPSAVPQQLSFPFTAIVATVFGGRGDEQPVAYSDVKPGWADRPGVALPYRFSGKRPTVIVSRGGKSVECPVVDVGPWFTDDPYWLTGSRPQAESGTDKRGRRTNLAGIDLTPAAAEIIDLPGKGLVDWRFKQEQPMAEVATATAAELAAKLKQVEEAMTALGLVLKEMQKAVAALQPAPVPAPAPAPAPILQQPGVGLGVFGGILTALLQWAGVVDVTQAGSVSQLLPLASAGVAGLGATGIWGPLISIGAQLLMGLIKK